MKLSARIRRFFLPNTDILNKSVVRTVNGVTYSTVNGKTWQTSWAVVDYTTFKTIKDGFRNRDEACDYAYHFYAEQWFLVPYETPCDK